MDLRPEVQLPSPDLTENEHVLVHNVLNELVNGLQRSIPVRTLHAEFPDLEEFWRLWLLHPSMAVIFSRRDMVAKSIEVVIAELGDDEFQTRVGVEIWEAQAFIKRLRGLGNGDSAPTP